MIMATLKQILDAEKKMAKELPLAHTTRCEWLNSFVKKPQIDPRQCPEFKEDLIYLFYGHPAYRSTKGNTPNEGIHLCPVCFVFKPGTVSTKVHRIFPCDTGALKHGVYKPKKKTKKKGKPKLSWRDRHELELAPDIASARKHVAHFFGANQNYFAGEISSHAKKPGSGAAKRWYEVVVDQRATEADERKFAIEVQVNQRVQLKGNLKCVVLPREFMEEDSVAQALKSWNCDVRPYGINHAARPSDGYPLIVDRVSTYYSKKGIL